MAKINFLSKNVRKILTPEQFLSNNEAVDRAAQILQEVFDEFLEDAFNINSESALLTTSALVNTDLGRSGRFNVKVITIEVTGYIYNLLDAGYPATTFKAEDYEVTAPDSPRRGEQLRAFPILVREGVQTTPESLTLVRRNVPNHPLVSESKYDSDGLPFRMVGDPVIFKKEVTVKIKPRKFTQQISKEAQRRIDREGLNVRVRVDDA